MKRQDVIEFLRSKTGYLKKGNKWIADKLNIDLALATECKKEVAASDLPNVQRKQCTRIHK